jgi:K+-transporting ATPase ATPase C chain
MATRRGTLRQTWTALRALLLITLVTGVVFPLVVTLIGQLALPTQANGSLLSSHGTVVGSSLIGQSFTDKKGEALSEWFQSRPSAATAGNAAGYDGGASSGSNLGPNNPDLVTAITDRRSAIEQADGVTAAQIPADAVTASGSGLDPHISPAYAREQVTRVAAARGIPEQTVRTLVEQFVQGRDLGYLGEPTVNVLRLNVALAQLKP